MDKSARKSTARVHVARALWTVKPETVEFRTQTLGPLPTDHARVRTLFSGSAAGRSASCSPARCPRASGLGCARRCRKASSLFR